MRPPAKSFKLSTSDAMGFEKCAFDTLTYYLVWFAPFIGGALLTNKRPMDAMLQWLPPHNFKLMSLVQPEEYMTVHLPFDAHGTHQNCYTDPTIGLHASFLTELESLAKQPPTANSEGFLCWCRGSAPIDFILVVRYCGRFELRFLDAKHTTKSSNTKAAVDSAEVREIKAKAKQLHNGIVSKLPPHLQACVDGFCPEHAAVITNDPTCTLAISPTTFQWEPWTSMLFFHAT